jgi:hypothetical protein
MEIVHQLEENRWRSFVDRHPHGNIFHTPEMFSVFARTHGYSPSLWAAVEGDDILALHLPVTITLAGGPLSVFTSRAVVFGSVLVEDSQRGKDAFAHLLKAYDLHVGRKWLFTELRNSADLSEIQPILEQRGYQYEDHENFLIDLTLNPDDLLASFTSVRRRHIRQGEQNDEMAVLDVKDLSQLPVFYRLLKKTYQWAHVPLADYSLFANVFEMLTPKGMARFAVTCTAAGPASAIVTLNYKNTVLNWYNGIDRAIRPPISNEYLFWRIFLWAKENGYTIMDMGGAGRPGEKYGVRDFKAKFNGKLVSYGRFVRVHSPLRLRVSQAVYGLARKAASWFAARVGETTNLSDDDLPSQSECLDEATEKVSN